MSRSPRQFHDYQCQDNRHAAAFEWGVVVALLIILCLVLVCKNPPPPVPPLPPEPQPVPADTGWHRGIDPEGDEYQIDLPYISMNDTQQDDANRFAHEYPEGH